MRKFSIKGNQEKRIFNDKVPTHTRLDSREIVKQLMTGRVDCNEREKFRSGKNSFHTS